MSDQDIVFCNMYESNLKGSFGKCNFILKLQSFAIDVSAVFFYLLKYLCTSMLLILHVYC